MKYAYRMVGKAFTDAKSSQSDNQQQTFEMKTPSINEDNASKFTAGMLTDLRSMYKKSPGLALDTSSRDTQSEQYSQDKIEANVIKESSGFSIKKLFSEFAEWIGQKMDAALGKDQVKPLTTNSLSDGMKTQQGMVQEVSGPQTGHGVWKNENQMYDVTERDKRKQNARLQTHKKTSTSRDSDFFVTDEEMKIEEAKAQQKPEQAKPINNMLKKQPSVQDLIENTMKRIVGDEVTTDKNVFQELSKFKIETPGPSQASPPSPSLETSQDKKQNFFYTDEELEEAERSSSWVEREENKEKRPSQGTGKG